MQKGQFYKCVSALVLSVLGGLATVPAAGLTQTDNQSAAPVANGNATDKKVAYDNMFIAYFSPQDVRTLADYHKQQQLGGYILWTLEGDVNPAQHSQASLLKALNEAYDSGERPVVTAYWENWSIYKDKRALASDPYPVPGSSTGIYGSKHAQMAHNDDFLHKMPYVTHVNYAFLEAQTEARHHKESQIGTVYFNDLWGDLRPDDPFCKGGDNIICSFKAKQMPKDFSELAGRGNFEAFANLPGNYPGKAAHIKTMISIGGYGHDGVFESIFAADGQLHEAYAQNFVDSVSRVVKHYDLGGVDLDYENPAMSHAQSEAYYKLIKKLNDKFAANNPNATITLDVLGGPAYISGSHGRGFKPGVLADIAELSHVRLINVMTYDFHGAFDYQPGGKGRTGFNTNVYMPDNAPEGYNPRFSVKRSVEAMKDAGVQANAIGVGVPAYGRSLANIDSGVDNSGLFAPITEQAIIPRGDMDDESCKQAIPARGGACSGSFSYRYIVNNMVGDENSFEAKTWRNNQYSLANGTTAYADHWVAREGGSGDDDDQHSDPELPIVVANNGSIGLGNVTLGDASTLSTGAYMQPYDSIIFSGHTYTTQCSEQWLGQKGAGACSNSWSEDNHARLAGKHDLSISWKTWKDGPQGTCDNTIAIPETVGKNEAVYISVSVTRENGQYVDHCDVSTVEVPDYPTYDN